MKNKIFLILILFVCLTGCTIKDNVTINYDGTVNETVDVLQKNSIIGNQNLEELVKTKTKNYELVLKYKNYEYKTVKYDSFSGAQISKKYKNICDYFGNSAFNQYVYKYMDCSENDYYYEIKNATDYIPYCEQCSDWPALSNVEFKITLPVSAEEQNADKIDGNTYIWKYNTTTQNDKSFYLKISKNALKQYEKEYIKLQKEKNQRKKIIFVSVAIVLVVIVFFAGIILYKKYKKNKLDY